MRTFLLILAFVAAMAVTTGSAPAEAEADAASGVVLDDGAPF
jgi:hypothetical protein